MKKSSYLYTALFILIFFLTLAFFYWLVRSPHFNVINGWIIQNRTLFIVSLFFYKTLGILWPPIPAGLFTLVAIPFIGWKTAYFVDLFGSISGGSIAYLVGRKFGYKILGKIFDSSIVEKIKRIKIKKGREIEAVFVYRLLLGSTILEAIYYGAGTLKVNYWKFLIGATLSHPVVGVPSFLLAENIFLGKNLVVIIILSIVALVFVYKTKGRYFE